MARMLDGKSVLVTGAAGGIGRASCLLFAAEGAKLVIADVDAEGVETTLGLVRAAGGVATGVVADLARREQIENMVEVAVRTYGRLDAAFNNAGVTGGQMGQGGRFTLDWDEEAFDRMININLKGVWLCMRAELRQMVEQGGGAILNTASLAGLKGYATTTAYSASKHAVVGMSRVAALEYAPEVRVNSLCPGFVDTNMLKDTMSRRGDAILAGIPFKRLADPKEMAEMACWALSDRASYASGTEFTVDGACMAG